MQEPKSRVELRFSCKGLYSADITSKSDPFCVLYGIEGHTNSGNRHEIGRTEVVKNNENPSFAHEFVVDYFFERLQWFCVAVYDSDGHSQDLSTHDFLGEGVFNLGEIAGSSNRHIDRPLKKGHVTVSLDELQGSENNFIELWLGAEHVDKKDFFGKSDPFFLIHKQAADGSWVLVHRSEVIKNNLNPVWSPANVSLSSLCNGDVNRPIRIEVVDWDSDGSHDFIGATETTVAALVTHARFNLVNPKKQSKKGYTNSGELFVVKQRIYKKPSFLDYILGGCELNFTVAVDFTGSNGNPRAPDSLHYINPSGALNAYESAIVSVGSVVEPYDSDKLFPALGFGAKIQGGETVRFDFPLNFSDTNPYCSGVAGIMAAYRNAIPQVVLWGPTNFSPVINHVARFAAQSVKDGWGANDQQRYYVLLIITDGEITDMPETISAIVNASFLPMSIIIVGVGNADFSNMNALDGDGKLLQSGSKTAARDIVQFVAMNEFYNKPMDALATAVLAEVPAQIVEAFLKNGVAPRPRKC
eukprot:Opistho-2@36895